MTDKRDPICGMTGVMERHGHWFCSERCVKEFEQRMAGKSGPAPDARRVRHSEAPTPDGGSAPRGSTIEVGVKCRNRRVPAAPTLMAGALRMTDPWLWVPASGVVVALIGRVWPMAQGVSETYLMYLGKVGIPIILGLALGGLVDHFIPKEYIIKLLSGPRKRVIARATILGFLASTCSHGCLALSLELYRKGASTPAVVSFLLASPWASMALTFLLLSLFGLKGMVIVAAALGISFTTGLIFQRVLARRGLIESNPHTSMVAERFLIREDIAARWRQYRWSAAQLAADARGVFAGMVPLGRMVLGWVQLGLVLSAVTGTLVAHEALMRWMGPTAGGLLATLALATVVEVCSEGTAPLAFELYRHTGAFGNAFAFLMGGVVTDYTELAALWTVIGRRTVVWMLLITLPMVIAVGWWLNHWSF